MCILVNDNVSCPLCSRCSPSWSGEQGGSGRCPGGGGKAEFTHALPNKNDKIKTHRRQYDLRATICSKAITLTQTFRTAFV